MGSCTSKSSDSELTSLKQCRSMPDLPDAAGKMIVDSTHRYDEEIVAVMRKEMLEEPQVFILNNLLMSVMFFEHYDKEITKISTVSSKQEKELNLKLINEESKQCVMPDVVFDVVNKHVRYRPVHGPKKLQSEPLTPQRMFVVHDNVEVLEPEDTAHYSGIDKPNYRVQIEVSDKPGFVKLRQIEQLNAASTGVDTPSSTSSESPKNSKTGSGISERCEIPPSSASNDGRQSGDSSDSYDYTTITKMNTPRPIDTTGTKSPKKNHSLPHSCFAVHMVKNLAELQEPASDDEDDDDEDDGERRVWGIKTKSKIDLFKPVTFISSKGFMTYFADTVFPNGLGNAIGFDEESIRAAKTIPGLIFCDSFDSGSVVRRHVIPGVYIQWPAAIAFEWAIRDDRPTIIDRRTTLRYKWPTDSMINEIRRLKCVVVPKGCVPKRGENRDSSVEWEVAFPKAEKYIETKMSHAQMRCFLFLVALHKTFIEPVTAYHGLLIEHIRNHMYWECEANYPNWPENRLGKKLLRVLRMLYVRLGRADMPGYFIREKNVFENVPGRYLRPAQELIHRVTEAPVMYFLVALRNIRYTSGKFYPALDFKRLHSILVSEGIRTANPLLYRLVENDRNEGGRKTRDGGLDAKAEWRKRHQEEIKRKFRMEEREKKKLEENLESQRRASVDSVDLQWSAEKNFDVYKQRAILMFFMDHFIEMAKKSLKLATSKQSLFYLRHAWYLSKLLEDTDGCYPDAVEYQARIRTEEDAVKRISASEVLAPVTPKRNPSYVLTNGAETTQQVRVNANKTFDSGLQAEVVHRKLKKQYANSRKVVSEIHQTPKSADSNFNDRPKTISFNADVHTFDA